MNTASTLVAVLILGLASLFSGARPTQPRVVRVHGAVYSAEFGVGLENATVVLGGNGKLLSAVTDARGRYAIDGVPPGEYTVRVDRPGWSSNRSHVRIDAGNSEFDFPISLIMHINADGPLSGARGIVSDLEGKPIEHAVVQAVGVFDQTVTSRTWTGSDGRYELGLPQAGQFVIYASKEGYEAQPKVFMSRLAWTPGVDFKLSRLPD